MNQTIFNTCTAIVDKTTIIDISAEIFKTQIKQILFSFVFLPFIFTLLLIFLINKNMKVRDARLNILIVFMLNMLISIITYLLLITGNFSFIKNIIG